MMEKFMVKKILLISCLLLICSCSGPYYAMRSDYDAEKANKVLLMNRSLRNDIEVVKLVHGKLENGVFFVEVQLRNCSGSSSLPIQYRTQFYSKDFREVESTNWKPFVLGPGDIITLKENTVSADMVDDYAVLIREQVKR